jgi:hypothetical protein
MASQASEIAHAAVSAAVQPGLNPIERVWKLARRLATHNRYFPALEDLIAAVKERFALWAYPNSQLRRLCAIT